MPSAAGANRDPAVFDEPERFDILRQPNEHTMLGFGRHFCLGAGLARLEGCIAFTILARHDPDLDFAVDPSTLRCRGDAGPYRAPDPSREAPRLDTTPRL